MAHRALTRGVAAGAATTFAVGALALFGGGIAGAAPGPVTWTEGSTRFTRAVSNATPAVGDTITVTTKFERTKSVEERLFWVKDYHDACLTYVTDSAKMNGNPVEPHLEIRPGFVAGDFAATSYQAIVTQANPVTFTAQYKVGENCQIGAKLNSGMDYNGTRGSGTYSTKGPQITVKAGGNGSLGSLFGS
ncbi:hypothetical protein [Rhodococcus maanshanensis]|uniref:Uncharacterized protein n=1 Tax=Rhodococcus maanshanensis TaxID=183556 RepID=A0A1H7J7Z2_9NOCA|nr:hypothetical protein [Rhodococcus maanshanensis]SEK70352.1 hypothetical protein SAMN05444583_10399 [Rhodococcus maanshanensis]